MRVLPELNVGYFNDLRDVGVDGMFSFVNEKKKVDDGGDLQVHWGVRRFPVDRCACPALVCRI